METNIDKRVYERPQMTVVEIQQRGLLCDSFDKRGIYSDGGSGWNDSNMSVRSGYEDGGDGFD